MRPRERRAAADAKGLALSESKIRPVLVKEGGTHSGATDEFGYKAVENRASVHDLQATVLHLMGLNREKLIYRHNGRDFRLTDVSGE